MSQNDMPAHSRASVRTLLVAILGSGAAALVTSVAAMSVGSEDVAITTAVLGGTAVLGVATFIVGACAARMSSRPARVFWAAAAIAMLFTTAGSALRASTLLSDDGRFVATAAENVYVLGPIILVVLLVWWPFSHRHRQSLVGPFFQAMGVTAVIALAFWTLLGGRIAEAAFETGAFSPQRIQLLLGFILVMTGAANFSIAAAVHLRKRTVVLPFALVSLGVLAMVAGDVDWLWRTAGAGWHPGSLADFVHIGSHVLFASAASLALDVDASLLAEPLSPDA